MIDSIRSALDTPVIINCFSLIILTVLFWDNRHRNRGSRTSQAEYFQYIVITLMLLLVTDAISFLVVGHPAPACRTTQVVATTVYYALDPLPSYFFIRFTDMALNVPLGKQNRLRRWYFIPVALHLLIALATPFTGWFFQIDAANEYHRGILLPLSFFLSFILMFIAAAKVLGRRIKAGKENGRFSKSVSKNGWLLKFTIIPLIGGAIQVLFYNITYVWHAVVIALLLLYINNQNTEITTDILTGVFNRRQAFDYFDRFVREKEKDRMKTAVAVVVLDINSFKCINDQYGHSSGDKAIIAVARCLETEFQWDDFVCRFGGDEFLVITKHGQTSELEAAVDRVNNRLLRLHEKKSLPCEVSVSAGYALYSRKNSTLDALFKKADEMMFEQKAKLMRRATDKHEERRG